MKLFNNMQCWKNYAYSIKSDCKPYFSSDMKKKKNEKTNIFLSKHLTYKVYQSIPFSYAFHVYYYFVINAKKKTTTKLGLLIEIVKLFYKQRKKLTLPNFETWQKIQNRVGRFFVNFENFGKTNNISKLSNSRKIFQIELSGLFVNFWNFKTMAKFSNFGKKLTIE